MAAKTATDTILIVFVIGEDPVKVGLVGSLSRPGGNITGMRNFMNVLGAKRLELVSEAVPTIVVLGLMVNPTNPNAEADTRDLHAAARALGRRLQVGTEGEAAMKDGPPFGIAAIWENWKEAASR